MDLEECRRKIDELDARLLDLLNRRARLSLEVVKAKAETGLPVYIPERETALLSRVRELNSGPLSDGAVQRLFLQVLDESRRLQQEHRTDDASQTPRADA